MDKDPTPTPFYKSLYFQVITAIVMGVALGHFYPETGAAMKPLGDGFIKLIKMIIAPIIFCTVVVGIGTVANHLRELAKSYKEAQLASTDWLPMKHLSPTLQSPLTIVPVEIWHWSPTTASCSILLKVLMMQLAPILAPALTNA